MSSVTCIECKSEIPEGVDPCPECGFHFADAPPIKCPECSSVVVFSGGVCPECGFPYDALDELLLDEELDGEDASPVGSQAQQLPVVAKHAAAASAAQSIMAELTAEALPSPSTRLSGDQVATLEALISNLGSYLEEVKSSNGSTLNDLSAGVEKFLEHVEQLKGDNHSTLQGMEKIAGTFSSEMKGVVDGIHSAKASALTDITAAAAQGKSDIVLTSSEIQDKVSGTVDYIFYISLAIVLFTALNMVVTMYVIKLLK